jgi:hypothetical protein
MWGGAWVLRILLALSALSVAEGCGNGRARWTWFFSFEGGMEGWEPRAFDTALGSGEIPWSIATTADAATDGGRSLRLYLDNSNDAGKIFVEHAFALEPRRHYRVTLELDLGTSDWGDANAFVVIAGVLPSRPLTSADLAPGFRDSTSYGSSSDLGRVWLHKRYAADLWTDATGGAVVAIGIWGTWEGTRTYYVDSVAIQVVDVP